jgi:transitional endoplasmic reticulum ATPase
MSDDEIRGDLMKVVHVDEDLGTVFFRLMDGRTALRTGEVADTLVKNDVILNHSDGWLQVPSAVWPSSFLTSVVRDILEDGTILGESGSLIVTLDNSREIPVAVNCTVEIDGSSDIQRVLSNQPIRGREQSGDKEDAAHFLVKPSGTRLTFDDFGGYKSVVDRAKELIETQLQRRDELASIGARPVKGVLFSGPPGTGKTHLARIIASQSDANFYSISGPAIVSKWVGDSENMLRSIFDHAESANCGKSIIFFDEIDSIAEDRSGNTHESSRKLVAQLLTLMDGFDNHKAATVVIAATNRADALDPALTRPGRFDWEIEFGLPSLADRYEILRVGTRHLRCSENLPLLELAVKTDKWSAARLSSIWTEAALIAASDKRYTIASEDAAQAYERVAQRPERIKASEQR